MTHDKIKAAARKRMAETGESYAIARREVIKNYRVTQWLDRVRGKDSGYGGVEVDSGVLRARALDLRLDIPRGPVRSVARSDRETRGNDRGTQPPGQLARERLA